LITGPIRARHRKIIYRRVAKHLRTVKAEKQKEKQDLYESRERIRAPVRFRKRKNCSFYLNTVALNNLH